MLDLDPARAGVVPKDAATLLLLRDGTDGLELLCVERSRESRFMGGAIVFPGGKVDASDASPEWIEVSTPISAPASAKQAPLADSEEALRALAIAACRETLEEAAILPITKTMSVALDDRALARLREVAAKEKQTLPALLKERGVVVDLSRLRAISRWITPVAESRRYDTRFFIAPAPEGQSGVHDGRETTSSFWARPSDVLARFDAREIELFPPTHRMLEVLAKIGGVREAIAYAEEACLDPICPRLVPHGETIALVLPGDPEHEIKEARIAGKSRFILRNGRFVPGDPGDPGDPPPG